MPNPPSATRRIRRPAALIAAAFAIFAIACLATGWQPWQVRRAFATGDPGQPQGNDVVGALGSCHLKADMHAWPAWLVEGLRTHPDDHAPPTMAAQPPTPVRTTPHNG
jgi:hypothetical protein